jgi:hypothetical protein
MKLLEKIYSLRKNPADKMAGIQEVIENLRFLSKGERYIAEFYRLCGDVFADEKAFWYDVAKCEQEHAEMALIMADLIEKEPEKYGPGKSFSVSVIRLFGFHVENLIERMRKGKILKQELLSVAADLESSVLELCYGDIVRTNVKEYCALARKLDEDTKEHRKAFEERMMNMSG